MYYWDLTIDMVSTIVLIIGVGLSVDYASHVGHSFLVQTGNSSGNIINKFILKHQKRHCTTSQLYFSLFFKAGSILKMMCIKRPVFLSRIKLSHVS